MILQPLGIRHATGIDAEDLRRASGYPGCCNKSTLLKGLCVKQQQKSTPVPMTEIFNFFHLGPCILCRLDSPCGQEHVCDPQIFIFKRQTSLWVSPLAHLTTLVNPHKLTTSSHTDANQNLNHFRGMVDVI